MKIILWTLIIGAVIAVCVKKVRDFKEGRYCGCGCSDCLKKCKKAQDTQDNETLGEISYEENSKV